MESWARRREPEKAGVVDQVHPSDRIPLRTRAATAARRPAVIAAVTTAVAAPVNTMALAGNEQVILIERGEVGKANAQ